MRVSPVHDLLSSNSGYNLRTLIGCICLAAASGHSESYFRNLGAPLIDESVAGVIRFRIGQF
jgi:hypothetical protein